MFALLLARTFRRLSLHGNAEVTCKDVHDVAWRHRKVFVKSVFPMAVLQAL